MGAPPGENDDEGAFRLQNHEDKNLSLEKIADFLPKEAKNIHP